ncbi:hypothetical protein ACP70R_024970 [Stipagrostis hirtigluma subsp. patula]
MAQPSAVVLLHLRRLDRFLKRQGLHRTAHVLERESLVCFDAAYLQRMVRRGRWGAAWHYLRRFSPLWEAEGEAANYKYTQLLHSLSDHSMLAFLACRGEEGGRAAWSLPSLSPHDPLRERLPEVAKCQDLFRSMTSAEARASVNWEEIKRTILEQLQELLRLCPDLDRSLRMRPPQHMPTPTTIIPLGLRVSRRHQRKRIDRKPARELAHFLLQNRQEITKSPSGFSIGASDSVRPAIQIEPAALQAPAPDATTVAVGILGGDGSEAEDASKSRKRKMSAMPETDDDTAARLKARIESPSRL